MEKIGNPFCGSDSKYFEKSLTKSVAELFKEITKLGLANSKALNRLWPDLRHSTTFRIRPICVLALARKWCPDHSRERKACKLSLSLYLSPSV